MSDTSLVFNVLARERVSGSLGRVASLFRNAGQQAERATRQATQSTERLDREIQDVERSLASLNAEFAATGNKELFAKMKRDRSLLTNLRAVRKEVGAANDEVSRLGANDGAGSMLGRLGQLASQVGGSLAGMLAGGMQAVSSNAYVLAAAAAVAAGSLLAIGPAASLAGAAVGSLPGIFAAAAAAMATLKLGTMGLSENWKAMTKVGGGAAKAARDMTAANRAVEQAAKGVARAERDVRDAQLAALEAQKAINEARETAADRMRDQALDLEGAQMDVAEATKERAEAEADLAKTKGMNDPTAAAAAEERYKKADLALRRAKARVDDLTEANDENVKKGVEGSDEVVAAKKREQDARRRVADAIAAEKDAEQRLADARKALNAPQGGGGGGGGPITPKIAASAREFLNVLKELKPKFDDLQLGVQQRLFAGLGGEFRKMATAWLPQLNISLGGYADTFNRIAKTAMSTASKKTFIDNMAKGAEAGRQALDRIGRVVAGPLTTAFGQLSAASAPFIKAFGEKIARALERFAGWIDKISKNGQLDAFFKQAVHVLDEVGRSLKYILSIGSSVMSILFGADKQGADPVKGFADSLKSVADWMKDPENQKMIREFIVDTKNGLGEIITTVRQIAPVALLAMRGMKILFWPLIAGAQLAVLAIKYIGLAIKYISDNAPKWWRAVSYAAEKAAEWITGRWNALIGWFGKLPSRISKAASGMWNGIRDSFRSAVNWIIRHWNDLEFNLPSVTTPLGTIGGGKVKTPNISLLAQGGIVPATPGGRLAVIGEGGEDEAVIPLSKLGQMGGGVTEVVIRLDFGPSEFGRVMANAVRTQPAVASAMRQHLKVTVTA